MLSKFQHSAIFALGFFLLAGVASSAGAATNYTSMTQQLRRDSAARPDSIHLYDIGAAAVSHRPIWLVRVSGAAAGQDVSRGMRLLLICRQHGDEPVSTEAALRLLKRYSGMPQNELRSALGAVTLYIVPMANPDGADNLTRLSGAQADLNRDWGRFTQPETRAIYSAYKMIRPQMVVDMHSWTASDPFQGNSTEVGHADHAANPAAAAQALLLQSQIVAAERSRIGQTASAFSYLPSTEGTLCHRFFAQQDGVVSLLVESAAGSDNVAQMNGRIVFDQTAIGCLIQSMRDNSNGWQRIAASEHAQLAPETEYTASALALNGSYGESGSEKAALQKARATEAAARQAIRARHTVVWVLGTYLAACIVLACRFLPLMLRAWNRLRPGSACHTWAGQPVRYVSVRRRHFPATPTM